MASKQASITEIPAADDVLDMLRHSLNRGVMVQWINNDLMNRADCDVRKSIVLYDDQRTFVMALGTSITPDIFRERLSLVANSMAAAGIRYYSIGVK